MPRIARFIALLIALPIAACGGGSTRESKSSGRNATPLVVFHTPQQLLAYDGSTDLDILYRIVYRTGDPVDVDVEFGVDVNRDEEISEDEYRYATPGDGTQTNGLATRNGRGEEHAFRWKGDADLSGNRHVAQDYVWTVNGRIARDTYGDPIFADLPGTRIRIRARAGGIVGPWAVSDRFDVDANETPRAELDSAEIDPGTGEIVVRWRAIDEDGDAVTLAVDWAPAATGTPANDLRDLDWRPASPGTTGEGVLALTADGTGITHSFSLDADTGDATKADGIAIRIRPLDAKNTAGYWTLLPVVIPLPD